MTKQKDAETKPEEGAEMCPEEGVVKRLEEDGDMTPEETTKMRLGQHSDEFREKGRNATNACNWELSKEQESLK